MLADIGLGIFSAIFASHLFQIKFNLVLLLVSIFFVLLPDIDFVIEWIKEGRSPLRLKRDHREIMHLPLLYIPIGSIIVFWFGWAWLFLFVLNSLLHFLHDSLGPGWGIKWLYPFSNKKYKLGKPRKGFKDNWIKEIYLRPTLTLIIEVLLFLGSLVVLFLYLK